MGSHYPALFSPIKIGKLEIKNRIVMSPMAMYTPRMMSPNGAYTKEGADYYIARAKGGAGLIVTGLLKFSQIPKGEGPADQGPGFYTYIEQQKYLADNIHSYGAKVFIQLSALYGRTSLNPDDPAPSKIQNVWDPTLQNREMSKQEIHHFVDMFANTALACKLAGIDGVEIHAVHEGYLLDQFTIKNFNHRTDEYGGSLENRIRFPVEIVQAIKKKCGNDFVVSLRYSVKSYMKGFNRGALPGEKYEEFGRDYDESFKMAQLLADAGYDVFDCDNGSYDSWFWCHPPVYMPHNLNYEDVKELKRHVSKPVICGGKFDDPNFVNNAIEKGSIDMMGMGRPFLADPNVAKKFKDNSLDDIRPCIGCHNGCLSRITQGKDISCAVNPVCGREHTYQIEVTDNKKKVLIVGGGLAGMEAARVASLRGHEVELFEKTDTLGGAFIPAAAFEYKKDDRRLLHWYRKQLVDLHVNIHLESLVTEDFLKQQDFDELIIATGAKERKLNIPGLDNEHVSYATKALLSNTIKGENILIVGGGLTGIEIACEYGKEGKNVVVVEATDTILNSFGLCASNYNMLMEMIEYYKIEILTASTLTKYENGIAYITKTIKNFPNIANRAKLKYAVGPQGMKTEVTKKIDNIVLSVGYETVKNHFKHLKQDNVHYIGDVVKAENVMKAIWDAYDVARSL